MNNRYEQIAQYLKQQGLSSTILSKTWAQRPQSANKDEQISWLKSELVTRGYVAEYVIAEIPETISIVETEDELQKFSRFTLFDTVGAGAMGKVYRAFDPHLNQQIALKILVRSLDKATQRFITEGQILARLHHQNIVRFYEVNQHQGQYYLTMEYIDGVTLREWLSLISVHKQNPIKLFHKICVAVAQVHQCGIIHRDLKPENIMVNSNNEPIVMDFGLAKQNREQFSTIAALGTPNYMSPEQAKGEKTDFSSDIFSLGIILYEIITARLPFVGENDFEILPTSFGKTLFLRK